MSILQILETTEGRRYKYSDPPIFGGDQCVTFYTDDFPSQHTPSWCSRGRKKETSDDRLEKSCYTTPVRVIDAYKCTCISANTELRGIDINLANKCTTFMLSNVTAHFEISRPMKHAHTYDPLSNIVSSCHPSE